MAKLSKITVKAFGKLNLMLDITGVRDDGYHLLETVMQSVSIYDLLEFSMQKGKGIKLICDKENFPLDENNLIWKAINEFCKYCEITLDKFITVKIEKNLPSMAGMAGGSADCAAALNAMNLFYGNKLSKKQLCEIGVKLGADVPFCIMGGTRLCRGIGEKITELNSLDCCFTVVKPEISISTPAAFKKYDSIENPLHCNTEKFLNALKKGSCNNICAEMFNALEYASENEEISQAKKDLENAGAVKAMMTGSGSAVFGVFRNEKDAANAAEKLSKYSFCCVCRPVKSSVEIIKAE